MAGRPDRAEHLLRVAVDTLVDIGDTGHLATIAPAMADILIVLGRAEEAVFFIDLAEKDRVDEDMDAQISCRRTRAKLLAHRGEFAAAERLAAEAVDLAQHTDFLAAHAVALDDLATVHEAAGHVGQALDALDEAIRLHTLKGNVPLAAAASARRTALVASQPD
jgi:ATP/maltotriose-dependent transcriptional regulator MalT